MTKLNLQDKELEIEQEKIQINNKSLEKENEELGDKMSKIQVKIDETYDILSNKNIDIKTKNLATTKIKKLELEQDIEMKKS